MRGRERLLAGPELDGDQPRPLKQLRDLSPAIRIAVDYQDGTSLQRLAIPGYLHKIHHVSFTPAYACIRQSPYGDARMGPNDGRGSNPAFSQFAGAS
jgi:hypothetical protein